MTDEQIISRVRGGETRLFAEIVHRYQDAVFTLALRMVASASDAEDVAQEAFLRVHRGLEGFKGESQFSTWLFRITCNLCTDWQRKNSGARGKAEAIDDVADIADGRVHVEQGLLDEEEREGVRRALDGLPEKYRTVLVLHYYQKMPYEQIASILGQPLKTIETRLYRARRMLRERLARGGQGGRR
jgi:RNA polymerase sigma-70 factor, ECF subfamily